LQQQQARIPAAELELEGYSYYDGPTPQFVRNDATASSRQNSVGALNNIKENTSSNGTGGTKRRYNAPSHIKYHPYLSTGGRPALRSVPPTPTETFGEMSLGAVFEQVGGGLASATTDTVNPVELSSKPGSGASTVNHSRRQSVVNAVQVDLSEQIRQYELLRQRASFHAPQHLQPQLQTTLSSELSPAFDFMTDGDAEMRDINQEVWQNTAQPASLAARLMASMNDLADRPPSSTLGSDFEVDPPESPQFGMQDWGSNSLDWHPLSRQVTHVRSPSVMSSTSSRRDLQDAFQNHSAKENGLALAQHASTPMSSTTNARAKRRTSAQSWRSTSDTHALTGQYAAAAVAKVASMQDAATAAKARQDYELATEDLFAANENLFEYGPFEDISMQYESTSGSDARQPPLSIGSSSAIVDEGNSRQITIQAPSRPRPRLPHRGSMTLQLLTEAALAAGVDNPATGMPSNRSAHGDDMLPGVFGTSGESVLYGPYDAGASPESVQPMPPICEAPVVPAAPLSATLPVGSTNGTLPVMNAQGSIRIERLPPKAKQEAIPVPQLLDDMTVAQLKSELRKRGLMATGKKDELKVRLGKVWCPAVS
jgi:hypothetical protein